MKNVKMLLCAMVFLVVSSVAVAMEAYKPKVYVQNNNTTSLVGASVGVKCIVNGVEPNGDALYIRPGDEQMIGQLGIGFDDIITLDVRPSSGGMGLLSGIGKKSVYPLTTELNRMLVNRKGHANQDIVIGVDNNTWSGYWQFTFSWRDRSDSGDAPIAEVVAKQEQEMKKSTKPAPSRKPAGQIAIKKEAAKPVEKAIKGQGNTSMRQAMGTPDLMSAMQGALAARRAALEGRQSAVDDGDWQ